MEYENKKYNFFLNNDSIYDFLKNKTNKNLYVTRALKNANLNFRSFVHFTRNYLNPKSSLENELTFYDLYSKGKLENNTIIGRDGIQCFAATGAKIELSDKGIKIGKNIKVEFSISNSKVSFVQLENDFNDNDICAKVLVED